MPGDPRPALGARTPTLEKYDLIEEIGHGGMATVYRARDPRLGRDVAVKIIHAHLRASKEVAHRFAVEAKAVARLRHPNIVEVFDVSSPTDREQYLVVELLRGQTLRELLDERGALPPEAAAALGLELLSALGHAHERGIVHRDVKPENVFLEHPRLLGSAGVSSGTDQARCVLSDPDQAPGVLSDPDQAPGALSDHERAPARPSAEAGVKVKLMDFGIAKLLDAQGVTSTGQVLGSPAHMAPEQIEGADVDPRADIFALGVLLYECMVGRRPFEGANPAQVLRRVLDGIYTPAEQEDARIGKGLSDVLDRALAHLPGDRYPDAASMRTALEVELSRVGVATPRAELDAWCADPNGYAEEHRSRMVPKLAALGHEARRRNDVLGAAAAYNRALAYAPDDAALLAVVGGMHRSRVRARLARRAARLALAVAVAGAVAFFVARSIRTDRGRPFAKTTPSARAALSAMTPAGPSTTAGPAAPDAAVSATPIHTFTRPFVPPLATRRVTVSRLVPVAGVLVSIDGAPPERLQADRTFVFDASEHRLDLTCVANLCEPTTRTVPAGAKDDTLVIELKIRPALLVVEGDPTKKYVIVERPEIALQVGVPAAVVFRDGADHPVTIKEIDTGRTLPASLRVARTTAVHFVLSNPDRAP